MLNENLTKEKSDKGKSGKETTLGKGYLKKHKSEEGKLQKDESENETTKRHIWKEGKYETIGS